MGIVASTAIVSVGGLIEHAMRGGGLGARVGGSFGFYMTVAGILMVVWSVFWITMTIRTLIKSVAKVKQANQTQG